MRMPNLWRHLQPGSKLHILLCLGAFGPLQSPGRAYGLEGTFDRRLVFSSRETLTRRRRVERAEQREVLVAPVRTALSSLFAVFFPSDCRLCDTPLVSISRLPVCPECLSALGPIRVPQCVRCGERLVPAQLLVGDGQCQACRDYPPEFDRAVSFGEYEAELRDLIHLLKYEGVLPAAAQLGRLLSEAIRSLHLPAADVPVVIVPVPLHSSKQKQRGFNQAELIAKASVKRAREPFRVEPDVLVRQRPTHSQVGLAREERVANMRGAFRVVAPERIAGRNVIVVDDVMTTGATVSECARVLKKAGAEKVWAATVARALKMPVTGELLDRTPGEGVEAELVSV